MPICGKIFEKIIFNNLYTFFEANNILSPCQSGFRKGDSCISQLLAITQEIFLNFDANPSLDTRGVFLDISKAFDKVWHEGLLFKLKTYGISGSLLKLIKHFLSNRQQRITLNGQTSRWKNIKAGVPQGSVLGPLFFLIFINDLPEGLKSNVKIFADDTSLFSVMHDNITASNELCQDLNLINKWAYQWKMSFNPDLTKQATEVFFSTKTNQPALAPLTFNNSNVAIEKSQKHLGMILDSTLSFSFHLKEKIDKANKGICVIRRLFNYLPRHTLLTIYKAFVRPHLDYGDIIYHNPNNDTITQKIESVQYNAALAITGAIRGTSKEKLYSELGLEYLSDRRWCRRLCFFYKIINNQSPSYLRPFLAHEKSTTYNLRRAQPFVTQKTRTNRFKYSFFPHCTSQWNNLDKNIQMSGSLNIFKRNLLNFIKPKRSFQYNIHHPYGLKLLTRLRVGLSHLRAHKFHHNFNDTLDPFCLCGNKLLETVEHFLLHCPMHSGPRKLLFDDLRDSNINIFRLIALFLLAFYYMEVISTIKHLTK